MELKTTEFRPIPASVWLTKGERAILRAAALKMGSEYALVMASQCLAGYPGSAGLVLTASLLSTAYFKIENRSETVEAFEVVVLRAAVHFTYEALSSEIVSLYEDDGETTMDPDFVLSMLPSIAAKLNDPITPERRFFFPPTA